MKKKYVGLQNYGVFVIFAVCSVYVCIVANSSQTIRKICISTSGCLLTTKRSGSNNNCKVIIESVNTEKRAVVRKKKNNKIR